MGQETALLQSTLDSILQRLSCVESSLGITPTSAAAVSNTAGSNAASSVDTTTTTTNTAPASVLAFDQHTSKALTPFVQSCQALSGLSPIASHISTIWNSMRDMIQLASHCRKPSTATATSNVQEALAPHLEPIQNATKEIRQLKLDRSYDWHIKAIMEMLVGVSWVVMTVPPAPSSFIKETLGATEFWTNKIRKEYKTKDSDKGKAHIEFCDTIKVLILDLSAYVKEYHLSGLGWNPRGVDVSEYVGSSSVGSCKQERQEEEEEKKDQKQSNGGGDKVVGALTSSLATVDFRKELAAKRSNDGNSAATGLRKVTREQQTWRKEYKGAVGGGGGSGDVMPTFVKPSAIKAAQKQGVTTGGGDARKKPTCQFHSVGNKWVVEYQTKESQPNGVCTVEIQDPKEQVYIYKCEHATIQIKGKLKSVILDSCHKTNLLFDTAISSCEIVNCQKVQIQSTGICPSFAIDKTDGCLIYLSAEAVSVSNFVTSKSSEMNVSWFDDKIGEQKEAPIPEQFVHKLVNGTISSEVSDLYH